MCYYLKHAWLLTVIALNPRKHIRTEAVIHSAKKYVLQRSLNLSVKLKNKNI